MIKRNLVLIGLPGSGKSTVSALLSRRLGWPLLDTDEMVVQREGRTIPEIFACEGGLSRRQVKEAVALAAQQSGFTDTHKHWKIDAWAIKTMIMNFITKPDFVSYCCCNLPYHRAKKKENRAVLTWTIRTQAEAERLRPWVDNMIFENFRPEKSAL